MPRRRLFIVQIDVPEKLEKQSKTVQRLKVRKLRKICYTAAGINQYRPINVAPILVLDTLLLSSVQNPKRRSLRILRRIFAMVYVLRDWGGSLLNGERLLG